MRNELTSCLIVIVSASAVTASDWLTMPSTYTHDPSGQRTDQYAAHRPAISKVDPSYRSSGYRQQRSTIQYGQGADNYHKVERWGDPVRPYGEWRFPVRPYSTPYSAWGAPLAGMNVGGNLFGGRYGYGAHLPAGGGATPPVGGYPAPGHHPGFAPGGASLTPYPHLPGSPYPVPPYFDGYHPSYGQRPRLDDEELYFKPTQ